jgi:putative membrane-bound dehydrogenase-like protein
MLRHPRSGTPMHDLVLACLSTLPALAAQESGAWRTQVLDVTFRAEGAAFGDLDGDGELDLVAGGAWYRGPDFREARAFMESRAWDPAHYSDHFFDFVDDLDGDGRADVLVVAFPGDAAHWYRNPGADADGPWTRHLVLASVDNESPTYVDLTGDGRRELVCQNGGRFGWAEPGLDPTLPWTFRALSPDLGLGKFTHGLGVGDVDGDGRADLLEKSGWWRQPESLAGDPHWSKHEAVFGTQGGAQMLVYDVDGDGDADVISSLAAHGFGLAWYEQRRDAEGRSAFEPHAILGDSSDDLPHGVCFAELHALDLCDVDGDGLADLVTGKRWWSHGAQGDPEPGSAAVLYWFRLVRGTEGAVEFVPHLVHADSGVGVDVVAVRGAGGGEVAIAVSNKKGTFVHVRGGPAARSGVGARPRGADGRELNLDFEDGTLGDWSAEGKAFADQPVEGDAPAARGREPSLHQGRWWIGGYERHGDGPTGTLTSAPWRIAEPFASFLVGGGALDGTQVQIELCGADGAPDGRVAFATSGAGFESMQRVVADLSAHRGELALVRLVDRAQGGWGHVNFDDLRLHAERPEFERPHGVPAILPRDAERPAGLAPRAAAAAMTVPEGFRVELVAGEPDLHQPVALAFDSRGRLWVAEAFTYPQRAPEGQGRDDIVVFEDADGDGSLETRTLFASGLNLVSGLEVGHGGVWVGAAPYLLFIPDGDGDLVPDGEPQVLLDGWGYQDTHETLNSFTWGPDGWLYGCHGVFTHSRVGAPGTPDAERVPIDAGVWRYHPTRRTFEVFAWGTSNPWGIDFDDHGHAFITACVIPHLFHVIQGARYIRQAGAHFDAHAWGELDTIADHRHWLGESPHGGNLRSDAAGGGHAHCGTAIYLGDAFPAQYRGMLLTANIHGNRLNRERLERAGSGFVGRHDEDFLLANDAWFRGINAKVGPDGNLYLIDWYDAQACHLNTPERFDRTNGRLYRVAYGAQRPLAADLHLRSGAELAALALAPNDWWVRRARLELAARGDDAPARQALDSILRHNPDPTRRLRALWALHGMGALDERALVRTLGDDDENVRAWAVQLALEAQVALPALHSAMVRRAPREPSSLVRLYLAAGLQRLPLEQRWSLAAQLVRRPEDTGDANIPLMLWWAIEPLVASDPKRAVELLRGTMLPELAQRIARRVALEEQGLEPLAQALTLERVEQRRLPLLEGFELGLRGRRDVAAPPSWSVLGPLLAQDPSPRVRELWISLSAAFGDPDALPRLRETVADGRLAPDPRRRALERLARARDGASLELLVGLLAEPELARDALRALSAREGPEVAQAVLERYAELDAAARREAVALLVTREAWALALLDAIDAGALPQNDLLAADLRHLRALGSPAVGARVEARWGRVRAAAGDKAEAVAAWKARLAPERRPRPDVHRGRAVFEATCGVCHPLFGGGGTLGPDLSGSNRADLDYLLENVLDPSAVIPAEYVETLVWLADGRLLSGVTRRADATAIVLQTQTDTHEIAREQIDELRESGLSIMPEGQLDALPEDDARDLVAYLAETAQVAPLAAAGVELFDGATLAGWRSTSDLWSVEDGQIVGRHAGLEANDFLISEVAVRDFRLTLEVRLVGDAGNGGVQFRSRALGGGDVAGYQADVGPGWWGKLYEEHGRAVLSEGAGEAHVLRDGWNLYEIEAVGARIVTRLNGVESVALDDPDGARSGLLALQLHSGGPTEIRFRNLRLDVLP